MQTTTDNADDDHDSPSDEDYDPSAAPAPPLESSASEDDEEGEGITPNSKPAKKKNKRRLPQPDVEDLGFDNSGDEATIKKGRKKRTKLHDDDEGGEGGLVKTRAQRKAEGKSKRPLAEAGSATVDVDSLWAAMAGAPDAKVNTATDQAVPASNTTEEVVAASPSLPVQNPQGPASLNDASIERPNDEAENMIIIKRKYDFAGQTMEEERQVPASSAEAKLYQAEQQKLVQAEARAAISGIPSLNRPKKRKSAFGPASSAAPSSNGLAPKKLSTIEKSKLDWAAHVDKEGIADELDEHSRAKDAYLGRMDFLERTSGRRVEASQDKPA